jgi:hypothetical protein
MVVVMMAEQVGMAESVEYAQVLPPHVVVVVATRYVLE